MVKDVVVTLSDREYQILEKLDEFDGSAAEKLKSLFINYLIQIPRLKAGYHLIKLDEKQDFLLQILETVYKEYEKSVDPLESWDPQKFERIQEELLQIEVIRPMGVGQFAPTYLFKKPWISAYNSTSKVFPDIDEFSQAHITTIYMLDFFSKGTYDAELLRDSSIVLNELYMFTYAIAKRKAHEFNKALAESKKTSVLSGDDLPA